MIYCLQLHHVDNMYYCLLDFSMTLHKLEYLIKLKKSIHNSCQACLLVIYSKMAPKYPSMIQCKMWKG